MKVIPLQKWVLLEVTEYNDTGPIIIPEHLRKKIPKGKILAKGDYVDEKYKVGDTILFQKQGTKALPDNLVLCPEYRIHFTENWLKDSIKKYRDVLHSTNKEA